MKNLPVFAAMTVLLTSMMTLNSCKNREEDPTTGFSSEIQKIVPQNVLNDLRSKGMTINEGKIPPSVEGIYRLAPNELLSPYGEEDAYDKGDVITAYRYQFLDQSDDNQSVKINYKSENGSDKATGLGSLVAGHGNKFTIFAEVKGRASSVDYTSLIIISGEITSTGITDFQQSLYLTQKSENPEKGVLIPLNSGRVWIDQDKIAEKLNNYRVGVQEEQVVLSDTHSLLSNQ